jgi:hypothetical protein
MDETSPTFSASSNVSSTAEAVELLQMELSQGGDTAGKGEAVAGRLRAVLEEAALASEEDGVEVIVAAGGLELAVVALDAFPEHAKVQV